ncbi:MAG: FAD-dependent oxidoreductase [Myxococcales bacterium]|nr:FAD-dependent oxidoreductase [Myxococcales bacterium]
MESTDYLIVGAGVSGLSVANFLPKGADWRCVEQLHEAGGYCRTIKQDGFVWDFSGHFFHFRHPDIEQFLRDRMPSDEVFRVDKSSSILFKGRRVDFPFQKNIHQLPQDDFIECLHDLYFREGDPDTAETFEQMLYAKLGRGITEKFLKPYNEKLYACDLSTLDKDAMGRFFPHADIEDIIRNMRFPDNSSYNAHFTYPKGGAMEYVRALLHDLDDERIAYNERLISVDLQTKTARTTEREIRFKHLVSAVPFPKMLDLCGVEYDEDLYTWNKVLVYNLGFDKKGQTQDHWVYIPERDKVFYRVGFYDNIFQTPRMSLYIEIGLEPNAEVDIEGTLPRVLADLERAGITDGHQLVSHHSIVLDPAYVHVNGPSQADFRVKHAELTAQGVHCIGRYGGWKYCSIEDNILEARALATQFTPASDDI